jgi:hypothetical protein
MANDDKRADGSYVPALAPRARNRTVVLTPELTGQVRARLNQDATTTANNSSEDPNQGFVDASKLNNNWYSPGESKPIQVGTTETPFANQHFEENEILEESNFEANTLENAITTKSHSTKASESGWGFKQDEAVERQSNQSDKNASQKLLFSSTHQQGSGQQLGSGNHHVQENHELHVQSPNTLYQNASFAYTGANEQTAVPKKLSLLVGFLVSYDNSLTGESFELRVGRTIVSSDTPSGGGLVLLLKDPTVSSMHAVIKATESLSIIIVDQLSEHGTFVKVASEEQERQIDGSMVELQHGDRIRFGERTFYVCSLNFPR